ncbi:hypothetical protein Tco_1403586 [Tanacetum coccineum]
MAQIIQCLGGKTRSFDQINNKDAIILYCLVNGVDIDYAMIFWEDLLNKLKEKTREKVIPYIRFISLLLMQRLQDSYNNDNLTIYPTQTFSANNLALKANQPEGPPFTAHMLAIYEADKAVPFKAPKTSSKVNKQDEGSKIYSLDHITAGTDPNVLTEQTKSISDGLDIVLTEPKTGPGAEEISNDPVIMVDDSEDDENIMKEDVPPFTSAETEEPSASSSPSSIESSTSFPDLGQLNELLIQSLKNELPKILSTHDFSSSLPTKLKDIPSRSAEALENTTQAGDTSVPSAGQASTMSAEGEKNTQATIS